MTALLLATLLAQLEPQPGMRDKKEDEPPPPAPALTKAPELLEAAEAPYPEGGATQDGEVVLMVDLDEHGEVVRVEVVSATAPAFAEPALLAATRLLFSPAEIDGAPAPVRIEYRYGFEYRPPPPPEPPAEAPVNFSGTVREAGFRRPVAGAYVVVGTDELTAITDAEGRFALRGVPAGSHYVQVHKPGYERHEAQELIAESERLEVDYYLPRIAGPYEIVVRAQRERKEVARVALEKRELDKIPGTYGDPVRVIENLPGMARVPGGLGGALLVRGANPQDSGVYFDGVLIPLLYHFGGLTSVINAEFLESIDFYPGGFGARYGRHQAGVVDVHSRKLRTDGWRGSAEVDLMDSSVFFAAPIAENLDFAIAGRRSYVDLLLPLVIGGFGDGSITAAPVYADYQLKLSWHPEGAGDLSLFVFGSDDSFELVQSGSLETSDFDFDLRIGFHRILAMWDIELWHGAFLRTAPFVGYDLTNIRGNSESGRADLQLDVWDIGVREDFTWKLADDVIFNSGLDVVYNAYGVSSEAPFPTELKRFPSPIFDFTDTQSISTQQLTTGFAAFAETVLGPWAGLKVVPGVRFDAYAFDSSIDLGDLGALPPGVVPVADLQWRFTVEPRITLRYQLGEDTVVKGAYGIYEQPPLPGQLNPNFGNPDLQMPTTNQFVVGLEQRFTDTVNVDLQMFYNDRYLYITASNPDNAVSDGQVDVSYVDNDGVGRSYGVEVLLRHELTERFFGWIAYTLSRSEMRLSKTANPPSECNAPLPCLTPAYFDQTHILTLVAQYNFDGGLQVGGRFRLVTGNPTTPIQYAVNDLDEGRFVPVRGETRSARLPVFHQADIRIDYPIVFDTWVLTPFLEIINAYNAQNVETIQYDYRFRQSAGFTVLPVLPLLGVKGEF